MGLKSGEDSGFYSCIHNGATELNQKNLIKQNHQILSVYGPIRKHRVPCFLYIYQANVASEVLLFK